MWHRSLALVALAVWSMRALWCVLALLVRAPRDALWAIKATRCVDRTSPYTPQLELVGPALLRLTDAAKPDRRLGSAPSAGQARPRDGSPVILYFTGTGETPEAALRGLRRLSERIPALSNATECVVAQPTNRGAYYNASQFAARIWDVVVPLVTRYQGPFILIGFSRGALVALDVATRIAEEHSKVAAALALSPPLLVPRRLPVPVTVLARFEAILEGVRNAAQALPAWMARKVEQHVWSGQVFLTAMVLKDLGMLGREELEFAVNDMRERGCFESGLCAAREFRLLVEAQPRESHIFMERLARSFAENPGLHAELVWGSEDTWVETLACRARMDTLFARYPAARAHMGVREIAGQGHSLFRAMGADVEPTLQSLARVTTAALCLAADLERDGKVASPCYGALPTTEEPP